MIGILPAHQRMAELHMIAKKLGGFDKLPDDLQKEFFQCSEINAKVVLKMIHLNQLSEFASEKEDVEWHHAICAQIDVLEAMMT